MFVNQAGMWDTPIRSAYCGGALLEGACLVALGVVWVPCHYLAACGLLIPDGECFFDSSFFAVLVEH